MSTHFKLLILALGFLDLHLDLVDDEILQLEVLVLIILVPGIVRPASWDSSPQQLDLLVKLMLLFAHLIDTSDQLNVVFHQASIVLTMLL